MMVGRLDELGIHYLERVTGIEPRTISLGSTPIDAAVRRDLRRDLSVSSRI